MKILYIAIGTLLGIVVLFMMGARIYRFANIDEGLEKRIQNGAVILDVRTPKEFNEDHIQGSVNISLGSLEDRFDELDTNQTYITYCSHGLRSVKAKQILNENGFDNVYNAGALTDLERVLKNIKQSK